MIHGMLMIALYVVLGFIALVASFVILLHVRTQMRISFYKKQGMAVRAGADRFFVGNLPDAFEYKRLGLETKRNRKYRPRDDAINQFEQRPSP